MHNVSYGEDFEYASSRLSGTVIRHDGWPVYVHKVMYDTGHVWSQDLLRGGDIKAPLAEFDASPVPLGFVNMDQKHTYARRIPTRHYKQGLNGTNFLTKEYLGPTSLNVARTIKGMYPSIMECAEYIHNEECVSKAFSRKFGLIKHKLKGAFNLEFINRKVGEVTINMGADSFNLHLYDEYDYLKETLEEAVNA